ncbi:hypothetical protein TWF730_003085 [Orbilia blumenaviensis]|uniref:DUF7514 domain-containing protein n=1 Tax=Orbilia blumenaviensis TaxID=1796055 RepID=A0AAV9U4C2_9PEZI
MSLRHTIKTLLSGPQTQAAPPGGYGYNQVPSPNQPQQQQYGTPTPYGYQAGAPVAQGGPIGQAGPYGPQQGQPMMSPTPQAYGYAPPPSQIQQTFAPPPQQQPYQYHCPQAPLNSAPVYQHNVSAFTSQNTSSYGHPSGTSPPQLQQTFQHSNPHLHQYSPTPPATATFPPHAQAQGQYLLPVQQYTPPPIPSASHPNYQPATAPVFQQQQQQPSSNPAVQYAQTPLAHRQDQQQPPPTPLSPPPPYMRFEQPSLSQSIAPTGQTPSYTQNPALDYAPPQQSGSKAPSPGPQIGQQQQQQQPASPYLEGPPKRKSSTSKGANEYMFTLALQGTKQAPTPFAPHSLSTEPASVKPESEESENFEGTPPTRTNTDGLIHPSMLAQWSAATAIKTGPIPILPSAQAQLPPKSASPGPSVAVGQNNASSAPPQPTYPGGKGHRPTGSVNRSFTFSKKNADGSPNWNGTLLTIDGMSSETFTRFVNGVYNFAGQDEDPLGLTPDQVRVLLERLDMPDERNYPKRYSSAALINGASDPTAFVNTSLIQYYSIFDVTYITESGLMPIVTRDGFQQYMTTEVLINPSAMHGRFLRLLTNFGHQIIDPFTKRPFGNVQFERGCLPPVPNDQYVARDKKQQEALQAREEANSSQQYYGGEQQHQTNAYPQSSSWGI